MRFAVLAGLAAAVVAGGARAPAPRHPAAEAQALKLAEPAIALRSVRGPRNQTAQAAELFKPALTDLSR